MSRPIGSKNNNSLSITKEVRQGFRDNNDGQFFNTSRVHKRLKIIEKFKYEIHSEGVAVTKGVGHLGMNEFVCYPTQILTPLQEYYFFKRHGEKLRYSYDGSLQNTTSERPSTAVLG